MLVVSKLIGGLGNQMFQYAAGRAVAKRMNCALALDTHRLLDHSDTTITLRNYELRIFSGLAATIVDSRVAKTLVRYQTKPVFRAINKARKILGLRPDYVELGEGGTFHYNAMVAHYQAPAALVYLDGYWQNQRYFEAIAPQLRQELTFPAFAAGPNLEASQRIAAAGSRAISVHIRRGDYLQFADHGLCSVTYYEQALALMMANVPDQQFFVFSDDLAWVKSNIPLPLGAIFIDWNQGVSSYHDLHLMSQCRHHIIANSSFSWWGAWLNNHPNKLVISPRNWMGNPAVSADRVVPESWHKL